MKSQMIPVSMILLGVTSNLCSASLLAEGGGSIRGRVREHNKNNVETSGLLRQKENQVDGDDEPAAGLRIINGEETEENEYPFVVSLQDSMGHFCGGSLIAKDVVLSAAHCQGGDYEVAVGRHDVENGGQVIKVAHELPHEDYDADTTDSDFMLIFLKEPVDLVDGVGLVRLNNDPKSPRPGDDVTVMGWGVTDTNTGSLSDVLIEVSVNVITNEDCDASGDGKDNYNGQITENMLCAKDKGEDSCQGDSGGPLVLGDAETGYAQVGVVSWGIGCADPKFPGVYSRISQAYDWIACKVCNESMFAEEAGFDCDHASKNCGGGGGGGGGGGSSQNNDELDSNKPDDAGGNSSRPDNEDLQTLYDAVGDLLNVYDAVGGFSDQSDMNTSEEP
ncbi:hypothetical protein ACHAW5_007377 [Stephanodiscus triporus]|uniref:Peptidase S1 domain-containing protein n=1 Tax=Stephanodiscus triporus TaxID=2934178 RepID=A0ABD3MR21_9STRA